MKIIKKAGENVKESGKKIVGYDHAKSGWDYIRNLANLFNPKNVKSGKIETFQIAYERLGLDEETLKKIYKNHLLRFYIGFGGFVIALILLMYATVKFDIGMIFATFGFIAVCGAQMFSASFRVYQIKLRQLVPVSQWFANKAEWLPTEFELPPAPVKKTALKVVKTVAKSVVKSEK